MPVLTAIDVLGVQRFIFSSNRLRDVVTGSFLVHWSTSRDRECHNLDSNIHGKQKGALSNLVSQEDILFAGGGNAIIEFSSIEEAQGFAARYSRLLHDQAPGLEVVVGHKEFDSGGLARALREIQIELARTKTERLPPVPPLGLSVTASCRETGLPATGFDVAEPTIPLSKGILKRRAKMKEANGHWHWYLKDKEGFSYPMELDDLGRTIGDTSLIGVVHVDGNGVGEKIKYWLLQQEENGASDEVVRQGYREWSLAIDQLGQAALQAVVDRIHQRVEKRIEDSKELMCITGRPSHLGFDLKKVNDTRMLPVRPILLGGDDLTFVCDGRIALDLAETALAGFEGSDVPHLGQIRACAGVAMVRVHAPFARAYEMAERLCTSAKAMLKERNVNDCALDWHIGPNRPGEAPATIRERQYRSNGCRLTCRPYRLGSGEKEVETWRWLSSILLDDPGEGLRGTQWSRRRNKAKALSGLVREGPGGVKAALEAWSVVDKHIRLPQALKGDGFFDKSRTPLLDALELLDLHLTLESAEPDKR